MQPLTHPISGIGTVGEKGAQDPYLLAKVCIMLNTGIVEIHTYHSHHLCESYEVIYYV